MVVSVLRLGRMPYMKAYQIQKVLEQRHLNELREVEGEKGQDTLILVEHDPVYTIGIRRTSYPPSYLSHLRTLGAETQVTNRGGLITFHGPGQLVVYPVLNLKHFHQRNSMKWYVSRLEECVIQGCKEFGVQAERTVDTGVWVRERKICAIGVHGSRYITTHGLAWNSCIDLDWYTHIIPCGIEGKGITSLTIETGRHVSTNTTAQVFLKVFENVFECTVVESGASEKEGIMRAVT